MILSVFHSSLVCLSVTVWFIIVSFYLSILFRFCLVINYILFILLFLFFSQSWSSHINTILKIIDISIVKLYVEYFFC